MTRVALIIPARDEEATIGGVVREAIGFVTEVIVVDNGSRDATVRVATEAGARVVSEPRPGYGRACNAGVAAAGTAEVLLFMDGDGSDEPQALPALLAAIEAGADLALGVRRGPAVAHGSITSAARFGNWLSGTVIGLCWGRRLHDLSPQKAVRRDRLEALALREQTYGWTVELLARAARAGLVIQEVDVGYRHRAGGRSKVSGDLRASVRAGVRILATLARVALGRPSPTAIGAISGFGIALTGLVTCVLWLLISASSGAALVAVWLAAWPVLLGGLGVGALFGAAVRRKRDTGAVAGRRARDGAV